MPNSVNDQQRRFIVDKDRRFTVWNMKEIFTGKPGGGRYVPNENDQVNDWDTGVYRVVSVDYTTGISTLKPWEHRKTPGSITNNDILLGVSAGCDNETYRLYIDKREMPYTVEVNARIRLYHSTSSYVKLFLGTDISPRGTVISAYYDNAGNILGENIPLVVAAENCERNVSIKTVSRGFTSYDLQNGELVTAVVYSDTGNVISTTRLLVHNTSLVRPVEATLKYVTGIRLVSPFLAPSSPNVLHFPLNINTESVPMMGIVHYSDGSESLPQPVGRGPGSRFALYGIDHYVPTLEGMTVPMTLNYVLRDDEYSYIQGPTANASVTEAYWAKTVRIDGAYSLKLFAYPTWRNSVDGYDLEFFLYNLDRRTFHAVPKGKVRITEGFPAWDGNDYLRNQRLSLTVNLKDVDPQYNDYHHVQVIDISLKAQGGELRTNWLVNYNYREDVMYGQDVYATINMRDANAHFVKLDMGLRDVSEWLDKLYYPTIPLVNTWKEDKPPVPDAFVIRTKRRRTTFDISEWRNELQIVNDLEQGETIYIEWVRRGKNGDQQLAISGLPVRMIR